jgi:DNA repair protein RecN (Recombination protein N)
MLEELTIENYALIDTVSVRFDPGLNILSGETGAGKSIIIGALGLVLGQKGDSDVIRTGMEQAVVSAVVDITMNRDALEWVQSHGYETDDGKIIVRRILRKSGGGSLYLQGNPTTRSDMAELMSVVFDLHGQHEHQSLLSTDRQRRLVDEYGKLTETVARFRSDFELLSTKKSEYEEFLSQRRKLVQEADYLEFAVKEIDEAGLRESEEESLQKEKALIQQAERLFSLVDEVYSSTVEGQNGALAGLRRAMGALESIAKIDEDLAPLSERLSTAFYEVEDIADTIRSYRTSIDYSPSRLEECEERLAMIHRLEKKYGATVEDVLAYRDDAAAKLESLRDRESGGEQTRDEIKKMEREILDRAKSLTAERKAVAKRLSAAIGDTLLSLGMSKARFDIVVTQRTTERGKAVCGSNGFDRIEFLISPNPGEELKALRAIASGGELSRIMLAIKTVLADADTIQAMIFDEVDAGIGGEIAVAVGEHLQELSRQKQVLCITHLASIAVRADNHIKVEKEVAGERTVTRVTRVEGVERTEEIARMLSGDTKGEASVSHAKELLAKFNPRRTYGSR